MKVHVVHWLVPLAVMKSVTVQVERLYQICSILYLHICYVELRVKLLPKKGCYSAPHGTENVARG